MIHQIEVFALPRFRDPLGEDVRHELSGIGLRGLPRVETRQLYRLEGPLNSDDLHKIAGRLLIDPVTERYSIRDVALMSEYKRFTRAANAPHEVEVWLKHGVTDTVAESVHKALRDLGFHQSLRVRTGRKYVFHGSISPAEVERAVQRLLVNPMIQEYTIA